MKKLKGSSDSIKLKYVLYVFASSLIILLPTRVYQLLALVETETGFFAERDVTVYLVYMLVILFPVAFMALSYMSREVPSPKLPVGKNPVLGIASGLLAAGLVYDIISIEKNVIPVTQANMQIFISVLKANISQAGGFFTLLRLIFGFLAVIYFAVFAVSHLNGRASYKEFKILALSPLCWSITRLISHLMKEISFLRVSELLFEIFMLVFLMLFFMTFARISSGVFTEDSMWGIYGYGLSASLFAGIVTVPRIVMFAVGKAPVNGYSFNLVDLVCAAFVLCYIFASFGVGYKDGIKNRRSVSDIALPDDETVIRKNEDAAEDSSDDHVMQEATVVFDKLTDETPAADENGKDAFYNYADNAAAADSDKTEYEDSGENYQMNEDADAVSSQKEKKKRLFGRKEKNDSSEEFISPVSLAELKNKNDD